MHIHQKSVHATHTYVCRKDKRKRKKERLLTVEGETYAFSVARPYLWTLKDKENRFNFPNARTASLLRLIRSSSFFSSPFLFLFLFLLLLFLHIGRLQPRHFALFVFRLPVLALSLLPVKAFPLPRRRIRGFSALPSLSR